MGRANDVYGRAMAAVVLVVLVGSFGCARRFETRFVDAHRVYTLAQVDGNAKASSAGDAARIDVSQASAERARVLGDLRRQGATASAAADLMTRGFPTDTKAVPYLVEAADVDGKPCWIILEAYGRRTGVLGMRRLWVFDRATGDILDARTFR